MDQAERAQPQQRDAIKQASGKRSVLGEPHVLGAAYPVALPSFEGPLDLLLQLIEREELDITEVSLVAVTDQYLRTIEQMEEILPGALADFLVIASRLLYIKSRSLLPKPVVDTDEEEEDSADALIKQLIEYRQFKEVAAQLKAREEAGMRVFARMAPLPELERRLDLSGVDLQTLQAALHRALERIPDDPPMPRVKTYPITVAEQIDNVRSYLRSTLRGKGGATEPVLFSELLSRNQTRMEVVVTFLAVLELIKQQEIHVIQTGTFHQIALLPVLDASEGATPQRAQPNAAASDAADPDRPSTSSAP